jgi:hypothetical protein
MAAPKFQTVPDDLIPVAEAAFEHLRMLGYKVRAEVADYAAPFTPTITAIRSSTVLHLEVQGSLDIERLREWVAYGKSASRDTRLAACVPASGNVASATIVALKRLGVGLFAVDGGTVVESVQAIDLAMHVELPKLYKQPAEVRHLLGHVYEQFDRGEWREGFENACNALEEESRKYFAKWSKTGRIKVITAKGPKQMTAGEIKKLSLGQLAGAFREVLAPNSLDVALEQALTKINPDRVERTHRRGRKRTEARLRKNVGEHMWLIVSILRQLKS